MKIRNISTSNQKTAQKGKITSIIIPGIKNKERRKRDRKRREWERERKRKHKIRCLLVKIAKISEKGPVMPGEERG